MQTVIITAAVQLPPPPLHLVMAGGLHLPLSALTEDGAREIGEAYAEQLIEAGRSAAKRETIEIPDLASASSTGIDINATPRMIALDERGQPTEPGKHVAVLMPDFGLMFDARPLVRHDTHKKAMAAASSCTLFGFNDWTAGTLKEQLLAVDRTRVEPATFTDYFPNTPSSGWLWTADGYASDSSGAWGVVFDLGHVYIGGRDGYGFVRAVRRVPASQ